VSKAPDRITRRRALQAGAATFVGYAMGVDKVLAQATKTDTDGIVAGDATVKVGDYGMPVYEARPAAGGNAPIVVAISEVWGVHEWVKDVARRFAKAGYCYVAPELFQREGGGTQLTDIQAILNPSPADVEKLVQMLKPNNPTAKAVVYPGAGHAFFADYRPSYDAAAAAEGWKACLAHVDAHLKA
jgi:dienelactone hydrolase